MDEQITAETTVADMQRRLLVAGVRDIRMTYDIKTSLVEVRGSLDSGAAVYGAGPDIVVAINVLLHDVRESDA